MVTKSDSYLEDLSYGITAVTGKSILTYLYFNDGGLPTLRMLAYSRSLHHISDLAHVRAQPCIC